MSSVRKRPDPITLTNSAAEFTFDNPISKGSCGCSESSNVDMDEKTTKDYCIFLMNENMTYKFQNQDLTAKIQAAQSDVAWDLQKSAVLQSLLTQAYLLTEQINELKSTIVSLQAENELLKAENKLLKDSLVDYMTRLEVLEESEEDYKSRIEVLEESKQDYKSRIDILENRDKPITVREAIRVLESFICLEAVGGSKTKFKNGNHNVESILKKGTYTIVYQKVLTTRKLTADHMAVLSYLKDCGDFEAHASRPKLTKTEFYELVLGGDEEQVSEFDDAEAVAMMKNIKKDLLNLLEHYAPCPGNGPWDIKDPVAKPMKTPTMKLLSSPEVNEFQG
jgi:regulator of replication initiation timing